MANNNTINTNIDDYSIDELLTLIELEDTYRREDVIEKVEFLNKIIFKNNTDIKDFFIQIQNRLIDYYNDGKPKEILLEENSNSENEYLNRELNTSNLMENILPNFGNNIETMENMNSSNKDDVVSKTNNTNDEDNKDDDEDKEDNGEDEEDEENEEDDLLNSKDKDKIENYEIDNYLHFNTLYRARNNANLETIVPATNSNFILSSPINNISQIKLASINIKKPYLICESKSNNKFIIRKYVKINNVISCDFSNSIEIEDGYYEDKNLLENYLNNNYFDNSLNANEFMKSIKFSINENSKKISFELSSNYISSTTDSSFNHFSVDFKTNYTENYSLATILGFDYLKAAKYYTSINKVANNRVNNNIIKSPFIFSNIGNTELFFCFDEYQSNVVETHKLFLNNNMSTFKILAKINASLGTSKTNYYINEVFSLNNDRNDIIRKYDGVINLLNFNVKIIDYYGNIINSNINENFTFTLESKIKNTRLLF